MYGALGSWGWPQPERVEEFEAEYNDTYLPLVRKVPHVVALDLIRADESGRESDLYRIGAMWFEDEERYAAASATPEWETMFACCNSLIERYGLEMRFAYVHRD
jgi:hypothetical protein